MAASGLGVKLKYKVGSAADVLLDSVLMAISPPAQTVVEIPTSTHADAWATFIPGRKTAGTFTFTVLLGAASVLLEALVGSTSSILWTITFSDNTTTAGYGFLVSGQPNSDPDGPATVTFTVRISGAKS